MPDVKNKKKVHPSGPAAKATVERVKEVSKRHQGGTQLVNEHQETIFDTDLSSAADDYAKAVMEHRLWSEAKKKAERALIDQMKDKKINQMTMGGDKVIKYKYVDAKEVITIKDYKPKAPRRRKF